MLVAGHATGEQILAPVLHPLHRCADRRTREHQTHLVALDHDLLPEPTARVAHHDADAFLGHPEQAGAEQPHLVGRLRRRVDRQVAGRLRVVDDEAAPFHRNGSAGLLMDRLAHDVSSGGEYLVEGRSRQGG